RSRVDNLYALWIEKSCHGYADAVLVFDADGVNGYITCRLDPLTTRGSIGLVGVRATARGRGVARHLISAALDWFAQRGVSSVSVITQARNRAAQRAYQRAGFLIDDVG